MKLSILVCSIPSRLKDFSVIEDLCEQSERFDDVEVLWLGDNRRMTTGAKRNLLVGSSSGEYVCFVDDDDRVSEDYVDSIREATDCGSDAICFKVTCSRGGAISGVADFSMAHEKSSNAYHRGTNHFARRPNHLCAIKRDLVEATPFKDISFREDSDFAERLKPLLSTETKIEKELYTYCRGAAG